MSNTKTPKRPEVSEIVRADLQRVIRAFKSKVIVKEDEKQNLSRDLGMDYPAKASMSKLYSDTARLSPKGIAVSQSDAGGCKTVKDAVNLTFKRAKGDRS